MISATLPGDRREQRRASEDHPSRQLDTGKRRVILHLMNERETRAIDHTQGGKKSLLPHADAFIESQMLGAKGGAHQTDSLAQDEEGGSELATIA